jgi:hypothetical protein
LTAEIPYLVEEMGREAFSLDQLETSGMKKAMQNPGTHGKGDLGTPDADRLFHKVHSQCLDIILTIRSTG